MRGSPENLAALRLLLAGRFPQTVPRPPAVLPTGVAAIDEAGDGGLPLGGITEVVASAPSSGGQLLIARLLGATRARRMRAALVDALDAFDPRSHEAPLLQHLVWVRCRTLDEAMHAADILVRDANLALVMLDLRGLERRALRGVPATTWYRLQRALERTDMALVVLTAEKRESGRTGKRETAGEIENRKSEVENGNQAPVGRSADTEVRPPRSRLHLEGAPCGVADPEPVEWELSRTAPAFAEASVGRPSAPPGIVGSARLRFNLASAFILPVFDEEQSRLASRLPAGIQRSRVHEERRIA